MRISYGSDLHLECGSTTLFNSDDAEVLVLAGDICTGADLYDHDLNAHVSDLSARYHTFFQECSRNFKHVIYVLGNHEYYDGDFAKMVDNIREKLAYLKNIYVLDRDVKKIGDVTFIGSTLWTDMNDSDPLTIFHIKGRMNDFSCIKNSARKVYRRVPVYQRDENGEVVHDENGYAIQIGEKFKDEPASFSPEDALDYHRKCVDYIKEIVQNRTEDDKFVVVGHHAPSIQSIHPRYKHDQIMNGGYMSSLEDFIIDRPSIKAWIHGHVHDEFDYFVGDTRIVCNPRGYVGWEIQGGKPHPLKTIEV